MKDNLNDLRQEDIDLDSPEETDWEEVLFNLKHFERNITAMRQESFAMQPHERAKKNEVLADMAEGLVSSYSFAAVIKLLSNEDFRKELAAKKQ